MAEPLRDEAVKDRIRAAEEFLDPRMVGLPSSFHFANPLQMTLKPAAIDLRSY